MAGSGKAKLLETDAQGKPKGKGGLEVEVQFNPETLRITYFSQNTPAVNTSKVSANQTSGQTDTVGSPPRQQTGPGSTRLTVQLWFDVTALLPEGKEATKDVRELTAEVAYFMKANNDSPPSARGIQFQWGTLIFTGLMESLDENLELFSNQGVPLRASVNIGISDGNVDFGKLSGGAGAGLSAGLNLSAGIGIGVSASLGAGTQPLAQAEAGVSLQAMASASFGGGADWQSIASANGIENPRLLQPGQLINLNARASSSASVSGSASASFSLTGE
jgi:hypothetical protein